MPGGPGPGQWRSTRNGAFGDAFTPSVAVAADGTIGVTYYDFRRDSGGGELTDHWLVQCLPAGGQSCAEPSDWLETRVTNAPFDLLRAPYAYGLFLGDYVGLEADVLDFLALFTQTEPDDPASIFFRRNEP